MNQLSYDVSNMRFRNCGFTFKGSIEKTVNETLNLLSNSL